MIDTKTLTAKELALYLGCECIVDNRPAILEGVSTSKSLDTITVMFTDLGDDDWMVYNDLGVCRLKLRDLESITEDELTEIAVDIFYVPVHLASFDNEVIKTFLIENVPINVGDAEQDDGGESPHPLSGYELTPQTFFNLTRWLIEHQFNLFGLIGAGLAIDKTKLP